MNGCILWIAGYVIGRKRGATAWLKRWLAAVVGGGLELIAFLVMVRGRLGYGSFLVVSHAVVIPLMTWMAFVRGSTRAGDACGKQRVKKLLRARDWQCGKKMSRARELQCARKLVHDSGICYIVTLLLGGSMQALENTFGVARLPLVTTLLAVLLCAKGVQTAMRAIRVRRRCVSVEFDGARAGEKVELLGLVDTGNVLHYARTGEPVHIASRATLEQIADQELDFLDVIPYETVQGAGGRVELYRVDRMRVTWNGATKEWKQVLLGVTDYDFFQGKSYGIILNGGMQCWEDDT